MSEAAASPTPVKGITGLLNLGLTCYANAVMQCMRHTSRLSWILEREERYTTLFSKDAATKERRMLQQDCTRAFADVIQSLWAGEDQRRPVRPLRFLQAMGTLVKDTMYEHLATKAPHDSHEFFPFLLETLHESMAQEVGMKILRPPPVTERDRLIFLALESWKREFSKEYSPLTDIFFGLTHWQTACQTCGTVSHRWESFNSLKLSIHGGPADAPVTFAEMLGADMLDETIEGYQCDKCSQRTAAKRKMRIWRLPQTLVLVVKRFTHDGQKMYRKVAAPEGGVMDFAPYFSEESPELGAGAALRYTVKGVVDHHGGSGGGHYTAQCCHPGNGAWYMYDDEVVMEMASGGATPLMPFYGDSTYMLFLERDSPSRTIVPAVAPPA